MPKHQPNPATSADVPPDEHKEELHDLSGAADVPPNENADADAVSPEAELEAYARSLEEESLLREIGDEGVCPSCRRFVERGWKTCPFCQTQLRDVCRKCEQLLSFNWVACPFCGEQRRGGQATQGGETAGVQATSALAETLAESASDGGPSTPAGEEVTSPQG